MSYHLGKGIDLFRGLTALALVGFTALAGCGAPPAPAPPAQPAPTAAPAAAAPGPHEAPAKEALSTGSDCLKAEAACDGGECVIAIKNACDQAISCDATMTTTCKSASDMIEAARRKRETFAAKTDGEMRLVGDCQSGEILRTAMKSIACK